MNNFKLSKDNKKDIKEVIKILKTKFKNEEQNIKINKKTDTEYIFETKHNKEYAKHAINCTMDIILEFSTIGSNIDILLEDISEKELKLIFLFN